MYCLFLQNLPSDLIEENENFQGLLQVGCILKLREYRLASNEREEIYSKIIILTRKSWVNASGNVLPFFSNQTKKCLIKNYFHIVVISLDFVKIHF